jgi:hypothetical protein
MSCAICETRRPRRCCPGVRGDICTVCCGTEREITVDCPLDCEFLIESRKHDRVEPFNPETLPNPDIRLSEKDLKDHEDLLLFMVRAVVAAEWATPGAVDFDVREALEAQIRTYRTLQSGVYYETVPQNPLAANVYRIIQQGLAEFREEEHKRLGMTRTRDAHVLAMLVYLQRIELDRNNGRRRGRAFLGALIEYYDIPQPAAPPATSSLILP